MSIYKKFIDSARKKSPNREKKCQQEVSEKLIGHNYLEKSFNFNPQAGNQHQDEHNCNRNDYGDDELPMTPTKLHQLHHNNQNYRAIEQVTMRTPTARTMESILCAGSTISSTPISRHHQYRKLQNEASSNYYHCGSHLLQHQTTTKHCPALILQQQHQHQQHQQQAYFEAPPLEVQQRQHSRAVMVQENSSEQMRAKRAQLASVLRTDDPILLRWLKAMRFETELECLTALQARTLAIDEHAAGALSVRNSQVFIQETLAESNFIIDFIDYLISQLPLNFASIAKFSLQFSELWTKLMQQTVAQPATTTTTTTTTPANHMYSNNHQIISNNLTIINCTPRKSLVSARTLRPLDRLALRIRDLCIEFANLLYRYQEEENFNSYQHIDNGQLESSLRKLKELYGNYVEISVRAECANIVRALDYDFSQCSLSRLGSAASLRPVRPFESSSAQLPLKWALIALWQLTKDDSYICRTLTEKWQTGGGGEQQQQPEMESASISRSQQQPPGGGMAKRNCRPVAKRLDFSTKYDTDNREQHAQVAAGAVCSSGESASSLSLRSDYEKMYHLCMQNNADFRRKQQQLVENGENHHAPSTGGALNSALKSKQQQMATTKQVSTIELLIGIIISQPNKHERVDVMAFVRSQAQNSKLIDFEELDQSISAAIYTSNQYKVAALRILNQLCVNEQAVRTILRCFSTPPPSCNGGGGHKPENKIIRSVFGCYQAAQEHIYQNETMLHGGHFNHVNNNYFNQTNQRGCKRARKLTNSGADSDEDYSDYGSRPQTTSSNQRIMGASLEECDESDDVVVREAIRLIVQLTAHFHKGGAQQGLDFYTLIGRFSIESLVKYLTNIIKSTKNREMLLLSLTALANISFITTEPMKLHQTNRYLLELFRASRWRSRDLELRDQVVTILANTADKNLMDLVSNGGVTFLLSCLESCPTRMVNYRRPERRGASRVTRVNDCGASVNGFVSDYVELDVANIDTEAINKDNVGNDDVDCEDGARRQFYLENKPRHRKPVEFSEDFFDDLDCVCQSNQQQQQYSLSLCLAKLSPCELAAMERVHQKAAVAFARMSSDVGTIRLVVRLGGLKQLIDLCKFSHKRNHSDTVLIACIAALRKMTKVIDKETYRHYNALDLIELELNQTLEIYGNPVNNNNNTLKTPSAHSRLFASDV